jgi:hypothetical protein
LNVFLNTFVREGWLDNVCVIHQILSNEMLRGH